jgi:hypothetical protein
VSFFSLSLNHEGYEKYKKKEWGIFSPLIYSQNGSVWKATLKHGSRLSPHHTIGFYLV